MRENLVPISIMSSTRINSHRRERLGLWSIAIGSTLVSIGIEQSSTIQPQGRWMELRRAQAYA